MQAIGSSFVPLLFEQLALHCKKPSFVNEEVFPVTPFADSQSQTISPKEPMAPHRSLP
jgi:hypothetical protein